MILGIACSGIFAHAAQKCAVGVPWETRHIASLVTTVIHEEGIMQRTKTLELTMLIVAAVLVFATLACGGSSSSTRQVANTPTPATIIHTVAAGETLAIIAARYGTTVEAIVAMNNIADPDKIEIGQKLTIPAPKGQVQPAATKPPAQSTPVPATDTPSLPTDTPQPPAQDAVCQCGNDTYSSGRRFKSVRPDQSQPGATLVYPAKLM